MSSATTRRLLVVLTSMAMALLTLGWVALPASAEPGGGGSAPSLLDPDASHIHGSVHSGDEAGGILDGVLVQAFEVGSEEPAATDLTYGGEFSLWVPPGNYDIVLSKDGYHTSTLRDVGVVQVEDRDLGELVLYPMGPVTTVVVGAVWTLADWERPVDDVMVQAFAVDGGPDAEPLASALTYGGAFELHLPEGTYRIQIAPPPFAGLDGLTIPSLSVTGAYADLGRFYLNETPYVPTPDAGQSVIYGSTRSAAAPMRPLNDVEVHAFDVADGPLAEPAASAFTYGGEFELHVPPGTYRITFTAPEHKRLKPLTLTDHTVVADQALDLGRVTLQPVRGLLVRVNDALFGGGLDGASVTLVGPAGAPEPDITLTTVEGMVLFEDINSGEYTLRLSKAGYEPIEDVVVFYDGGLDELAVGIVPDFRCTPEGTHDQLTNMGFESGLDGWTLGHQAEGVEVVGADEFTTPFEGDHMLRMGASAASSEEGQRQGPNFLCQDFRPTGDSESFSFNVFTYDYTGYDTFSFQVAVVDGAGEVLAAYEQEAWGTGTALKTSGWRTATIDTSDHVGERLHLVLQSGGTSDELFPFWTYVDSAETREATPVNLDTRTETESGSVTQDPVTGQLTVSMPYADVSDLTLTVAASCEDTDSTPTVEILFDGSTFPATETSPGSGKYTATIPAATISGSSGGGVVSTQVSCPGVTTMVESIGSIVLYDPSGIVSDATTGDPVVGAEVHLYKVPGWSPNTEGPLEENTCETNESKAPGAPWSQPAPVAQGQLVSAASPEISPHVNPFVTNGVGYYGWDVAEGCWFVKVTAEGYQPLTSPVVGVPSEVTDLDLELTPVPAPNPGGGGGGGVVTPPTPTASNTVKPAVTGAAKVGKPLSATPGTWSVEGLTFAYQWLRDGSPIEGATEATYNPVAADRTHALSVRVSATKAGVLPGTATSEPVTVGQGDAAVNETEPLVTGTPQVGEALAVSDGTWDLAGLTFTRQWLRDGEPIEGATEATYVVTEADQGTELSARVVAMKAGHADGSTMSGTVAVPEAPEPEPTASTTTATLKDKEIRRDKRGVVTVQVTTADGSVPTGIVTVTVGRRSVEAELVGGRVAVTLPKLAPGRHKVSVAYAGDELTAPSMDGAGALKVKEKKRKHGSGKGGGKHRPLPTLS